MDNSSRRRLAFGSYAAIMALVASEIGSALFSAAQATTAAPLVTRAVDSYSGPAHVTLSRGSLRVHANTTALNDYSQAHSSEISVFNGTALIFDRKVSGLVTTSISLLPTTPDETIVDVELFSGGAHCCFSDLYIYPASNAADVTSFMQDWGSYPRTYVRINGDILIKGSIGTDYSFGNFGGSTSAVILYGFSREGLRDVTRQHPETLERDAAQHLSDYNLEAKGRPPPMLRWRAILPTKYVSGTRKKHGLVSAPFTAVLILTNLRTRYGNG